MNGRKRGQKGGHQRSRGSADRKSNIKQHGRASKRQLYKENIGAVNLHAHVAKALCLANNVVLAAGHPFPGPFKFCKVINAAVIRALWLSFESSVGNPTSTEGLFRAFPAWTFLTSAWANTSEHHIPTARQGERGGVRQDKRLGGVDKSTESLSVVHRPHSPRHRNPHFQWG